MNWKWKPQTLLLPGLALALVLAGCQSQQAATASPSAAPATETPAAETTPAAGSESGTRIVTDMAGREVEVPAEITSVYSTAPTGTMLMYTFDDKLVTGLNVELSDDEKAYVTDYYKNLPNLGGWYGQGNQGNVEEIIKAAPDIVLSAGSTQSYIDQAEQLQEQLGIPVLLVETDLEYLPETYRFMGELLGDEARGEELAAYTEETIAYAKELVASIPEEDKVRVYYAEEQDGLHTDPAGSSHSALIDLCGGINVAECEITPGYGRTAVSIEQVMEWNPELIICSVDNGYADSSSYNTVLTDPTWSTIDAVENGLVFQTPLQPQNWFDRPPSANTIIGVKWTLSILYPDLVDFDIKEEAKEFYQLFYHVEIDDDDIAVIMDKALRE